MEEMYVVGVGASAGGLDALTKFVSSFNSTPHNFCVVIVQHLSPDYKSELASILGNRCKWPVEAAQHGVRIQKHRVYTAPPNCTIWINNETLYLEELPDIHSSSPSIDHFLISLAKSKRQKAIGIVLSGFGSDGSEGIIEIKKSRGFTMAQSVATAEHTSMPQSAIRTDSVDMVLDPKAMYEEIIHYINNHQVLQESTPHEKSVDAIFDLLAKRSGTDFSKYKSSTIMRRMDKRIEALRLHSHTDYYKMIKQSPKELDLLFETVLIGITEFFRDPRAFEAFKEELKSMLKGKKIGDPIRIWSVGCATGEEPYSIAILLLELLGEHIGQYHTQIFASDIDDRALSKARKGIYSSKSLEGMPPELLKKYFEKINGDYQIQKRVKQYVLFTKHDITNDPPFVKLDVISCRNLFIYFNNQLQKDTLKVFHYSLREQGMLFLGKSENVSSATELFTKLNPHKLFRKVGIRAVYNLKFSRYKNTYESDNDKENKPSTRHMSVVDIAKETLYYSNEHPFVIITENADIKEAQGSLRLYLEVGQGPMTTNLIKMINKELVLDIRALLARVKQTSKLQTSPILKYTVFEKEHFVKIKVLPFIYPTGDQEHYIVSFEGIDPESNYMILSKEMTDVNVVDFRIKELEQEVVYAREHMQTFTEELEMNNEELQSLNEELQSANEELKSANEELETSNEELQSANEELSTANNELRLSNEMIIEREAELKVAKQRVEESEMLYRTISEKIPNGTVGILNEKLEIEYVAGQGLLRYDVELQEILGKKLHELNPSPTESRKLFEVFSDTLLGNSHRTEFTYSNRFYSLSTIPLQFEGNSEKKVMYLTQDITSQRVSEWKFRLAVQAANLMTYEYEIVRDLFRPSPELLEMLEMSADQAITKQQYVELIHPDDRQKRDYAYRIAMETGVMLYEVRIVVNNTIKWIRVFGRVWYDPEGKPESIISAIMDITEDMALLNKIKESETRFRMVANTAPIMIWMSNVDKQREYFNTRWLEFAGRPLEKELGTGWLDSVHPDDLPGYLSDYAVRFDEQEPITLEYRLLNADKKYRWILENSVPRYTIDGDFKGYIGSSVDITEKKEFAARLEEKVEQRTHELNDSNQKLAQANQQLGQFAYIASHDLQEPLRKVKMFTALMQSNLSNKEKATQLSQKIILATERMNALIRSILEYSQINKNESDFKTVNLNAVVENVVRDCELLIEEKGANLQYGELGSVWGGEIQLYQLFMNLIKNALKFTEGEPVIEIISEKLDGKTIAKIPPLKPDQQYRIIRVKDNGIGFSNEFAENIFEMFKRLNSKEKYSGTGIGLALCRRIVEIHNGHIEAQSTEGEGATFTVYLPVGE